MARRPTTKRYVTLCAAWPQFRHAPQMAQAAEYAYVLGLDAFERQAKFRGAVAYDRRVQVKIAVQRRIRREQTVPAPPPPEETLLVA